MTSRLWIAVLVVSTLALPASAQTPPAPPAPAPQPAATGPAAAPSNDELDQRVKVLERKLELAAEQAAEKAKTTPAVKADQDGFSLRSADGAFQLRLRALVQTDGRFYLGDEEKPISDTLVLRRARPILEGTLFKIVDFRLMPDFGSGSSTLLDAYIDLRFSPAVRLRAGKAKVPVGLEALLEDKDLPFVERGLPSALAPVRDLGLQVTGEPFGGKLVYAAGVFNGVLDGASGDLDSEDAKEFAARLFFRPFQRPAGEGLPPVSLGIGLAGSIGDQKGTPASPALASYRSAGQQNVFSYRSDATAAGTTVADGARQRLAPQAWIYSGSWLALAEWTRSSQEVVRGASGATLTHTAWQIVGSWAVTGEAISDRGVTPRRPFDLAGGGRGALVLSLRYGQLDFDRDSFPLYADPAKAIRRATNAGVSLGWALNKGVRLVLDYQNSSFDGGDKAGDRETEQALLTRIQLAF